VPEHAAKSVVPARGLRRAVPERNLHAVPDTIDSDAAVFVEPLAAAFQVPAQLAIGREDRVIVLGDGRLGNLCAQVLAGLLTEPLH
jgi:threonine dehydrogenase-like Zn-dependent dehydrogenase